MKSDSFFKSKLFLIQVIAAIAIGLLLLWFSLFCLSLYTNHSQKIPVPNLYGKSNIAYQRVLKASELRYRILDSIYRPTMKEGSVVSQSPKAGSIVKQDRMIFLTLSTQQADEILFPNIKDNSFRQAIDILRTKGFSIGKLDYQAGGFFNLVQGSKCKGNNVSFKDLIAKGSSIDLVLGLGSTTNVIVPDLLNDLLSSAKDEILFSNLNIGQIEFDNSVISDKDILNARVWQQSPNADMYLKPGEKLNIWLSCDSTKFKPTTNKNLLEQ